MSDVHSAYSVLDKHPLGTDVNVVSHYDFLHFLGGKAEAARVLDGGLARFPSSWLLHDRLRAKLLAEKGVAGLEPAYEAMLAKPGAPPMLEWFAGYTSIVAAEFLRRAGKTQEALAAYDRAVAHYDRSIEKNAGARASADHYAALAIAGKARIALEHKEHDQAVGGVLASFGRCPEAAAALDGLNLSPVDTAKTLRARLVQEKRDDLVARVDEALGRLDPSQLLPPAYEQVGPASRPGSRGRRRGG